MPTKSFQVPSVGFRKTITTSVGKVDARVNHIMDTIDVKLYMRVAMPSFRGHYYQYVPYKGSDGVGKKHLAKLKVKTTILTLKLPNGETIKARSCCKPPDVFDPLTGVVLASHRAMKGTCGGLVNDDRLLIMKTLREAALENYFPKRKEKKKVAAAVRKSWK